MSKKVAIIESGFVGCYIDSFIEICEKNGIVVDLYKQGRDFNAQYDPSRFFSIFQVNNEIKSLLEGKAYDYVLSDVLPLSFACNVFHNASILKRLQLAPFFLYGLLFSLGHFHKILFAKNFFKKCPKTIVVSKKLKQDYSKNCNIPEQTFIVAYPGCAIDESNKFLKFKELKKDEPFVIGMNANGFVTKGGYVLLNALRVLKNKYPDLNIRARIIFPKYKKKLTVMLFVKFFGLGDIVEFLPYQKNMKDYYKSLNCFVCPSLLEAFGRVIPEAMGHKLPVIVSSDVGASDIIRDGENGFVYIKDKNYICNLAEKIRYIYENYSGLENLVEQAFDEACEVTWENFSKEIFFGFYPELDKNPASH